MNDTERQAGAAAAQDVPASPDATSSCVETLVRLMPRIGRVFKSQMYPGTLSPRDMGLLMEIQDGANPGELARRVCLSSPAVTAALDELVERGYCVRTHSERDRRKVLVHLTPKGAEILASARAGASAAMHALLDGWDDQRIARLNAALTDLESATEAYLEGPPD